MKNILHILPLQHNVPRSGPVVGAGVGDLCLGPAAILPPGGHRLQPGGGQLGQLQRGHQPGTVQGGLRLELQTKVCENFTFTKI